MVSEMKMKPALASSIFNRSRQRLAGQWRRLQRPFPSDIRYGSVIRTDNAGNEMKPSHLQRTLKTRFETFPWRKRCLGLFFHHFFMFCVYISPIGNPSLCSAETKRPYGARADLRRYAFYVPDYNSTPKQGTLGILTLRLQGCLACWVVSRTRGPRWRSVWSLKLFPRRICSAGQRGQTAGVPRVVPECPHLPARQRPDRTGSAVPEVFRFALLFTDTLQTRCQWCLNWNEAREEKWLLHTKYAILIYFYIYYSPPENTIALMFHYLLPWCKSMGNG